jgi:hypothetical protein
MNQNNDQEPSERVLTDTDIQSAQSRLIAQLKEKVSKHLSIKGLYQLFIADPLQFLSYLSMIIYYLLFSHVHLLAVAYCCSTIRGVQTGIAEGFDILGILVICYNLYQLFVLWF